MHAGVCDRGTNFQADKCYIISEISMLKIHVKNEDFHILDTLAQRPFKLFNY